MPDAEKLQMAGKTGSLTGTRAQTAVVWREKGGEQRGFAITVMNAGNPKPELWNPDAPGVLVIGRLARLVYDAWME